jgi:sigma-B regulation protein RsbU (phosphoserine phosphatase)
VGALRGMHKTGTQPATVLEVLNDRLRMRVVPGRYCSVLYAVYDPNSRELRVSSAGMPRPLRIHGKGCAEIGDGGLPSGLFEGVRYDQTATRLEPGDAVLFCTDGITDARDEAGNDFGHKHLHRLCASLAGLPAAEMLDRLLAAVDGFATHGLHQDDMTAAVLRILS